MKLLSDQMKKIWEDKSETGMELESIWEETQIDMEWNDDQKYSWDKQKKKFNSNIPYWYTMAFTRTLET